MPKLLLWLIVAVTVFTFACGGNTANKSNNPPSSPTAASSTPSGDTPSALPGNGFKAEITLMDPPAKLRTGERLTLQVKIKNASDIVWWARGARVNLSPSNKFYIAAGDRWLRSDGSLLTDMDGRYGISRDLKPGEETTVPLTITAPKEAGDYTLEVDLVQEQVAWFSEKGSPTAKTKVTVVR